MVCVSLLGTSPLTVKHLNNGCHLEAAHTESLHFFHLILHQNAHHSPSLTLYSKTSRETTSVCSALLLLQDPKPREKCIAVGLSRPPCLTAKGSEREARAVSRFRKHQATGRGCDTRSAGKKLAEFGPATRLSCNTGTTAEKHLRRWTQ